MPRVTRSSAKPATEAAKPYTKPKNTNREPKPEIPRSPKPTASQNPPQPPKQTANPPKPTRKTKDGKDSHLYTDDNPTTTLHGTGFKDAATARHTLQLISKRSLHYQFQTINTMFHRAKHHPHSEGNTDMQAAMAIFRTWLDETYPALRAAQRDFPLLKRGVVELYLPRIRELADSGNGKLDVDPRWAEMYIALPKGKRLANVLMDEERPGEADLARVRQDVLEEVIEGVGGEVPGKDDPVLWGDGGEGLSAMHLKCIAYGFSPCKSEVLVKKFAGSEKVRMKVG
ncbi:hypothetical protein OHC33_005431 [Knufia fluminis]|uniref:Uncharacterized protein n=1 Tax=Knufia fluminis TaxID=191047 RepID=A0AAN8ELC6_9EURO|nr:hypothetical protein OHC33_005431 [Knufia fluminis]